MGTNGGSKYSATISNATVTSIMSSIHEKRAMSATDRQHNYAVDVGINWLICNKTKPNESIIIRASKVLEIMMFFLDCGFSVKLVSDPEKHYHSKRASVKRRADKVVLDSSVIVVRHQLNNIK